MFLLKYLEVKEDEKEVLNIDFIGDREVDERPIFSTLILGENGTGKSFLLKTIVDIFIYISKAKIYKRKPKFKYSKFCVKYSIDGNEYCVKKESGRDIFCWKNGTEIVLDEVELPKKVLAVSFMVNDKFRFVKPGEDIGSIYKYLGVRKSTNSTYTSSVMQNVFYSVVHMMKNHTITELEKVLSVLHFDSKVEISFKSEKCNSESKMKKSSCIRKCNIDCSNPDYGKIEEVLEELEQTISSLDDKEKNKCNIAFYKKGRCIQFEDCSSGEKHMIFAFTGVLSSIEPKSVNKLDKRMIGIKELLYIIKENHEKIFRSQNATFLSLTDNKNKSCLELLIPDKYWKTGNGRNIFLRLAEDQRELSNLVNGESGHTGVKATRKELSEELCGENYDFFLKGNREKFEQWFDRQIIAENFSIECLPQVCSFLEKSIDNIKKGNGSNYKNHGDFQYDIDVFQKTLQNLCAMGRYAEFFWWLFMYAFFQSEITKFLPHVPKTQYSEMLSYLNNSFEKNRVFDDKQMLNVESKKFWDIRRKLVSTAYGHLIIAGPSLKDAFSVDDAHTIVQSLKESIEKGRLSEISVLLTDPIIFDSHVNCGDPIRDISGTVETLQERFYDLCERNKVKLHIYFLPLLQIDHAVITEEFMAFRSNKLWNRERKYKGAYGLYLANYYISHKVSDSEYLAHKEYLHTIMENSTTIYPAVDVDYSLLNKLSAKSKHMITSY